MSDILVIVGTGNMGRPLVKFLSDGRHRVSVMCRRKCEDGETMRLLHSVMLHLNILQR